MLFKGYQDKLWNTHISIHFMLVIRAIFRRRFVNNLSPLLFVTFQREFHVSLEQLALLVSLNFGTQILVDIIAISSTVRAM